MTVATNSYNQKVLLYDALNKTSDSMDPLKFQLHDFGYRGSTSVEVSPLVCHISVFTCIFVQDAALKKFSPV